MPDRITQATLPLQPVREGRGPRPSSCDPVVGWLEREGAEHERELLASFLQGVIVRLGTLLRFDPGQQHRRCDALAAVRSPDGESEHVVVCGGGAHAGTEGRPLAAVLPDEVHRRVMASAAVEGSHFEPDRFLHVFRTGRGTEVLLLLESDVPLSRLDRGLILLTAGNLGGDFEQIHAGAEIIRTQKELIQILGQVVESRSQETVYHTLRVAEYSRLLAELAGLGVAEARLLQMIAPMHDVGKVAIPDSILKKPGLLSPAEFELMKAHTTIGHQILGRSDRALLRAAAIVAHQHHERWDGKGYPQGLRGEEIHLHARIVALADVFDSLTSDRVFRPALPLPEVMDIVREGRGREFDPRLVDLFLEHIDEFIAIRERHRDPGPGRDDPSDPASPESLPLAEWER